MWNLSKAVILAVAIYMSIGMVIAIIKGFVDYFFSFKDKPIKYDKLSIEGIVIAFLWAVFYLMN